MRPCVELGVGLEAVSGLGIRCVAMELMNDGYAVSEIIANIREKKCCCQGESADVGVEVGEEMGDDRWLAESDLSGKECGSGRKVLT